MIFVNWKGWGFTVPIVGLMALVTAELACDAVLGKGYYSSHDWIRLAGTVFAALILWIYGNWLNPVVERVEISSEGWRTVHLDQPNKHTFLSIPAQYWAWVWLALGSAVFISEHHWG